MTTAAQVVALARSYIGTLESPAGSNCQPFSHRLGRPCHYWCADFTAAIFDEAGQAMAPGANTASTRANLAAWKKAGRFVVASEVQAGDVLFFHISGRNGNDRNVPDHTGIAVQHAGGSSISDVEGNTSSGNSGSQDNGGGVFGRSRPLGVVIGAGRPDYSSPPPVTIDESELSMLPRLVHFQAADYLVGYDGTTGEPWRRTIPNPSRFAQLVGGGGVVTNGGASFPVTNDQFLLVYADRGSA